MIIIKFQSMQFIEKRKRDNCNQTLFYSAAFSRSRVISEGAPKRLGGPQ